MTWFLSDLHLNHKNIIEYCNRPFSSVEEMNKTLIENWNKIVYSEDTVYCLGDLCLGPADQTRELVSQLHGKIILIRGNHDSDAKLNIYKDMGIEVKDIAYLSYGGLWFVMCHFPMTNEEFLKMVQEDNSEVVIVHGHVHDKVPFYTEATHSFNVSCDVTQFAPVPITTMWTMVRDHFISIGVWKKKGEE